MRKSPRLHAITAAVLLGAAFAANAQTGDTDHAVSDMSAADTAFIKKAAEGGMAEVQLARTALARSSDDKIKALAQQIVDDHTKTDDALKALAQSKKVDVPASPDKDAQKQNDKLQAMKPAAFDVAWSKAMVSDHQDAIKLFTAEGKSGKDADLRQFAEHSLPTLKSHLAAAQQLVALPKARDQAMDHASTSMIDALDSAPASGATTASPAPKTVTPTVAPAASPSNKH